MTRKKSGVFGRAASGLFMALVCAGIAGGDTTDLLQKRDHIIRVQSALVSVPVFVTDAQGRYLPGLARGEFMLYEDGSRKEIAFFAATTEPIHVALLLDTSKSTITVLDRIRKAASRFVKQLRPADAAMVVSFDDEIKILSSMTSDHQALERAVRRASVGERPYTRLRDALAETLEGPFGSVPGRKAIVLLSDGQDTGSATSPAGLMELLDESHTVVYSIHYSVDPREMMKKLFGVSSRMPGRRGRADGSLPSWLEYQEAGAELLRSLSEGSSGSFYPSDVRRLDQVFSKIAGEMRQQYLLGFYPEESKLDGSIRSIDVAVTLPGAQVRARKSYRAALRAPAIAPGPPERRHEPVP